jgi:hypothetical protein
MNDNTRQVKRQQTYTDMITHCLSELTATHVTTNFYEHLQQLLGDI